MEKEGLEQLASLLFTDLLTTSVADCLGLVK